MVAPFRRRVRRQLQESENDMRKTILLSTLAATIVAGVATAQADDFGRPCTNAPQAQWLRLGELVTKVEAQGYKVHEAELKRTCGEIEAIDPTGARVELFVDPTSGEIVGRKRK